MYKLNSLEGYNIKVSKESVKMKSLESLEILKSSKYSNYTGWLNLNIDDTLIEDITARAKEIKQSSDVLVVVGIGGSYLGSKAVIEALTPKYNKSIEVIYIGESLSPLDIIETLNYLKTKNFHINVISKSGTTLEPMIVFDLLKELVISKYGLEESKKRITITTDKEKGILKKFSEINNIKTYSVPSDVGGRFSVFSPVGLLPMAVAGIDIYKFILGAKASINDSTSNNGENKCLEYASYRYLAHLADIQMEILAVYEPRLKPFTEWWKQLFAESEGKQGKGIYPSTAVFSTDLHSIGQFIQEGRSDSSGRRKMIETHLTIKSYEETFEDKGLKSEGLMVNPTATSQIELIKMNELISRSAIEAHNSGGVETFELEIPALTELHLGYIMMFFMVSCAISSINLGVNPFNQPGVEEYKKNIKKNFEK